MFEKRTYHTSLCENGKYKIKSKGLLKNVRIVKNGFDPLPNKIKLIINGRIIEPTYNDSKDTLFFDFEYINNKFSNSSDDEEIDYHVINMIIMTANTKCIPHYSHLPLSVINSGFFTHEIELELKSDDIILPKELKLEEEYYLPTFKLNKKEETKDDSNN